MTHPPQQPLDDLQALIVTLRHQYAREGAPEETNEAADALERQAQEIQRLREALTNAREAMALSVSIPPEDERCRSVVTILCEQYGYGAIMSEASRQWREKLGDLAGGEFCAGPCRSTAEIAIAKIDAALSSQGE